MELSDPPTVTLRLDVAQPPVGAERFLNAVAQYRLDVLAHPANAAESGAVNLQGEQHGGAGGHHVFESVFRSAARMVGTPLLGHVLEDAEQATRPPCRIAFDFSLAVDDADVSVGPNDPVLHQVARPVAQRPLDGRRTQGSVVGVKVLLPCGPRPEIFLRMETEDAVRLV